MIFNRFDVIAVQYPFLEGNQAKRRPGLIVSASDLIHRHNVCWVAMITTAKAGIRPDDIQITDIERAGLSEPCVIRPARLTTLSLTQIARRLGSIASKDRNAMLSILKKWIGV